MSQDRPAAPLRLLAQNTFLVHPVVLPLPGRRVELGAGPAPLARARELADAVRHDYDVVALSEVFARRERDLLVEAWAPSVRPPIRPPGVRRPRGTDLQERPWAALGPLARPGRLQSSGLLTLVDGPAIVRVVSEAYRRAGSRLRDADALCSKGVLLTELDLGLGVNLELISTHLLWGGGLVPLPAGAGDERRRRAGLRRAQVTQLLELAEREHRAGNAQMIVGDLNVDHADADEHGELVRSLDAAGFDDLWGHHGVGEGPTCDAWLRTDLDPADPDDGRFATEPWVPAPGATGDAMRLDRALLRRPGPTDRSGTWLEVTVRALRRRRLPRPPGAPARDRMSVVSDHLGLHLELDLAVATAPSDA